MIKRILIWGASTKWYHDLLYRLNNMPQYSIVGFIDEDSTICDLVFMQHPVILPINIKKVEFDYILVPWWENIETVIKIISSIDTALVKKCVVYSNKHGIVEYNCLKPSFFTQMKSVQTEINLSHISLISHACGGWINDSQILYTNSKEALATSICKGHTVIEIDIMHFGDELVCAHRLEDIWSNRRAGVESQIFKDILAVLQKNRNLIAILDLKYESYVDYKIIIEKINDTICSFDYSLKKRIIIEVYDEPTILIAKKYNFEMIKTNYREEYIFSHKRHAGICEYYGIKHAIVCLNKFEDISEILYGIEAYEKAEVSIFGATINSLDKYKLIKKYGFQGAITDFLNPSN